jgi:thiamine transport system permease protein
MDGARPLSRSRPLSRPATAAILAIPAVFLTYFFAYPVASIVWRGIAPGGSPSFEPFLAVLRNSSLRSVAWFTLWQAALSTLLTLAVGLPTAYVFARFRFPGKRLLRAAATVPFVLPTLVVGTAFLALIGPGGAVGIDLTGTVWAILIAHVFYNYAIVVRGVGSFWEQIDPRIEDAARTLGASRLRVFREVTLPLLSPAVASAASLVFLFTFTSFGVVLILGDLRHATLEVEIWRQTTSLLRLDIAAALAVLQLIGVGVLLAWYGRYQQRRAREIIVRAADPGRPIRTRGERALVVGTLAFMALFLGTPMAVLAVRSLRTPRGLGFGNFTGLADTGGRALFIPATEAIGNTLRFSVTATLIAVSVGALAAAAVAYTRGRIAAVFDTALMVPLGTSAVTIGFGFLIALDRPFDLRTSLLLIPIAHALVAIPFVVRTSLPVMRSVQHRLREAAAVLGASPGRVWREVDLPIVSRALLVGAAFAFAISAGEFGATAFIARPEAATVPIAIFRLLSQPGSATFGGAMALSVILMVITGLAVLAIERLRFGTGGEL